MEPVSLVVAALAAGAAAGLKPAAASAVKDAYAGLKGLIGARYKGVDIGRLEKGPESASEQIAVVGALCAAGADRDSELLRLAGEMLSLLREHHPGWGPSLGIDLDEVAAAALRIGLVDAAESGVRVRRSHFEGEIEIGAVHTGRKDEAPNPPERR
jgi:hypothetical protein